MKNSSFTIGLALALAVSAASAASAQTAQRPERARAAQSDSGFRRGPGGRGGPDAMLLKGITLNDNQKARLQELRGNARKELGKQGARGQRPGAEQRQVRDTVGMAARRAEMVKRREQHFTSIRTILDAQQRAQFDKNVTELKAHVPDRVAARRAGTRKR